MGNWTWVGPIVGIPLSYGSSLTGFGFLGATKRVNTSGMTGKMTATIRKSATGPKVLSTLPRCRGVGGDACGAKLIERDVSIAEGRVLSSARGRTAQRRRQTAFCGGHVRSHRRSLRPDEHAHDRRPGPRLARRG